MKTIALQLYTVRQALAQDPEATLRNVREIGFRAVETAPLPPGLSPERLGMLLRNAGLEVVAAHDELPWGDEARGICERARTLGASTLIWHGWPRPPLCDFLAGYRQLAERCTEAARTAREHGLELGLHNHWWECEPLDGEIPWLTVHRALPPEIFFELDVYWARTAGLDPAAFVESSGRRVSFLHLKDGPAVHGQPMTALGDGVVDLASVLARAPSSAGGVVELDECVGDPFDAAARSLAFLRARGMGAVATECKAPEHGRSP